MTMDEKVTLVVVETLMEALLVELASWKKGNLVARICDDAATLCSAQIFAGSEEEAIAARAETFIADLRQKLCQSA